MVACYAAPPTQMPAAKDHALLKQPNCLILRDCPESPPRGWREATPPKQAVNRDRTFHSCTGNRPDVSSSEIIVIMIASYDNSDNRRHPRRASQEGWRRVFCPCVDPTVPGSLYELTYSTPGSSVAFCVHQQSQTPPPSTCAIAPPSRQIKRIVTTGRIKKLFAYVYAAFHILLFIPGTISDESGIWRTYFDQSSTSHFHISSRTVAH